MKRGFLGLIVFAAFAVGAFSGAAADRVPNAEIESISGEAWLVSASGRIKLQAQEDAGRIVYSGESLACVGNARVFGYLGAVSATDDKPRNLCNTPLTAETPSTNDKGRDAKSIALALDTYGKRAGRDKGSGSPIYAPSNGGAVLPENFIVRWRTRPPLNTFTAVLQDSSGAELASVPGADGASGVLDSDKLRKALTQYRATTTGDRAVHLIFRFETGPEQSVSFTVLSEQQEQDLDKALQGVAAASGLILYIERAAIFESFRMYGSVAAEYDAALEHAPESRDLLRAAVDAYSRIGDLHRSHELWNRLQQVEDLQ
ncbi:MAG TPA: hypothetical protein VHU83_08615 [Bryobacteraceae bacterium]|jgi:hypothetical protein|nr:hypothetical protein [Bryobacteraceae bacterium]